LPILISLNTKNMNTCRAMHIHVILECLRTENSTSTRAFDRKRFKSTWAKSHFRYFIFILNFFIILMPQECYLAQALRYFIFWLSKVTFKGKLELSSTGTSGILNQLARQDHSLIMFSALSFRKVRLSDIVMNETYLHHISCLVFKRPGAYQYDHFQAFWTRAPGKITHWRQDQDSRPARSV
jgi:hypothetical protein